MQRLLMHVPALVALGLVFGLVGRGLAQDRPDDIRAKIKEFNDRVAVGKIKEVRPVKDQFVLEDPKGKEWLFTMAKDGKIFFEETSKRLPDLVEGIYVVVEYERKDDGGLYAEALYTPAPKMKADGVTIGQIEKVFPGKNQFVFSDTQDKEFLFTMADKSRVLVKGKAAEFARLRAGDLATIVWARSGDGGLYAVQVNTFAK